MSSVWFSSDWHLGHKNVSESRGFITIEEHDNFIINNMNSYIGKKDVLYILGDVVWGEPSLKHLERLTCRNLKLILGNHDYLDIQEYLEIFKVVHGFIDYKGYWLSHCPVHPQEIRRIGNIHGHIHRTGDTDNIPDKRYFNVNVDYNEYLPISFNRIFLKNCT